MKKRTDIQKNHMKLIWLFFVIQISCLNYSANATNYYINTLIGNDACKGYTQASAWKTISQIANINLLPGDSILFATGQHFTGMLSLMNVKGLFNQPIIISSYSYKQNKAKPILDAGQNLNAILIQNASFIKIEGIEVTATLPYQSSSILKKENLRSGILVEVTQDGFFEDIQLKDVVVHDVYYNAPGFIRSAEETKSANGTQSYGWGIRFVNNTKRGQLTNVQVSNVEIFNVSHTGLKFTATTGGIKNLIVAYCKIYQTGGPGMQFSGVKDGHIHHNSIDHSGAIADSRNWGRGSGLWTWGCSNILIEHNRFENANGPGDSAGMHIDFNCSDVIVQYNISANNAGGFCEILGNNYNCAYRYNISINDGYRVKGKNGAFQEGKIFWLSGFQGNEKKKAGPYNSYFYNNTIYISASIVPKIAISSSADGVLIANNIFYFENAAQMVAGDQNRQQHESSTATNVVFTNNLFLRHVSWPADIPIQDTSPIIGNPEFKNQGGMQVADYLPANKSIIANKGIPILLIPNDSIGLRIGLKMEYDILGNPIKGLPDLGAIEMN